MGYFGYGSSKLANIESRQAAVKALEIDETLAEAHVQLAAFYALELIGKVPRPNSGGRWSLTPNHRMSGTTTAFFTWRPIDGWTKPLRHLGRHWSWIRFRPICILI
jgi:hypothetical protein